MVWLPWVLTGWKVEYDSSIGHAAQALGLALIAAGLAPTTVTFVEFARAGGTPVPGALTEHLVVSGFNKYVRNPIYLGVVVVIVGEALLFGQLSLLIYGAGVWLAAAVFVRRYEEPTLARRFGGDYEAYRSAVPAWRPRLHPWSPGDDDSERRGRSSAAPPRRAADEAVGTAPTTTPPGH